MTPQQAADRLRVVRLERRTLEPFTDSFPDADEEWGYAVQAVARSDSVARGDRLVGAKLGLTSVVKQQRMGVDRPIVGFLTESMLLAPDQVGSAVGSWVQPGRATGSGCPTSSRTTPVPLVAGQEYRLTVEGLGTITTAPR